MEHAANKQAFNLVAAENFECRLESVRSAAASPLAGIFGTESQVWRVDREAAVFLGAGRALLPQLAHPWSAAAITKHSRSRTDPIGRFHQTFNIVFTVVFGTGDQAIAAARRLHRRHAAISGHLPADAGRLRAGTFYLANDVETLRWVHATLVETVVLAHDLVLPPLEPEELDRYWLESRLLGELRGNPRDTLPTNSRAFVTCDEAMYQADVLAVGPAAREIAAEIFRGPGAGLRAPDWYRALTARMLPSRLCQAYELECREAERTRTLDAIAWVRSIYTSLPNRVRYVGPCLEAMARLSGRERPDFVTQMLNRFWIGRRRMSSGDGERPSDRERRNG